MFHSYIAMDTETAVIVAADCFPFTIVTPAILSLYSPNDFVKVHISSICCEALQNRNLCFLRICQINSLSSDIAMNNILTLTES